MVQDVLGKVHALVNRVSEEMGQHGDYLAEINDGLNVAVSEETKQTATSLAKLLVANTKMRERLAEVEARLQEQSCTIEVQSAEARIDSVTRLVNRQALDDEIKRGFAAYRRQGRGFSVVLLDVDHFGRWIDCHGHLLGDELLGRIATVLRDHAREMDLVARYGEERFAILLPGTRSAEAVAVASRMSAAVGAAQFACGGERIAVTLSAGVAETGPEDSVATLMAHAEAAVEAAKSAGRGGVCCHDGAVVHSAPDPLPLPVQGPVPAAADAQESSGHENRRPTTVRSTRPGMADADAGEGQSPYLCSRVEFRNAIARRMSEWRRGGSCLAVALVRIDDVRSSIEEYGFEVEPAARSALWRRIVSATRDMDLVGLDDQDTFAMLLPTADLSAAAGVTERLREAVVQRCLASPDGVLQFTVSSGVAEAIEQDQAEQLLARAEEALRAAVAAGGNRTFVYGDDGPEAYRSEPDMAESQA